MRSEGVDLSFSQTIVPYQVDDLRDLPLIERKRRLARLLGRAKHAIRFTEHLTGDGPTVSSVPWKSIPEVSERWSAWHASIWRWGPPC